MKTLEQIQKENHRMILEAIHGISYEQALEKELVVGCKVIDLKHQFFGEHSPTEMVLVEDTGDESFYFTHYRGNPLVKASRQSILDKNKYEILGKPLTLDRVLLALGKQKWWKFAYPLVLGFDGAFCEVWHSEMGVHFSEKFNWDFTKSTLEEQSETTIRDFYILMGGEND